MTKKIVVTFEIELEASTDTSDMINGIELWAEQICDDFLFENEGDIKNIEADVVERLK